MMKKKLIENFKNLCKNGETKQKRVKKLREIKAQSKQASKNVFEFDSIFAGLESFGDDIFIQNEMDNKAAAESGDIDAGIEIDEDDSKSKNGADEEDEEELEEFDGPDQDDLGDLPDIDPIPSSARGATLDEDSPEFFTLAHKVALGQKHDVIDSSFNRNWGFEDERAITDGISNAALLSKKALKIKDCYQRRHLKQLLERR